jgi:hypothetical protein
LEKRLWHSKAERKQLVTQLLRLIKVVLVSAILHTHEYKKDHFVRPNEPNLVRLNPIFLVRDWIFVIVLLIGRVKIEQLRLIEHCR